MAKRRTKKAANGRKPKSAESRGPGRPTDYTADHLKVVRAMAKLGATDVEMATELGVAVSTFYLWRAKHSEFSEAIKLAKKVADDRVEQSLYRLATGYTFDSEKVMQHEGGIVRAPIVEHVPPHPTALIFWLKNRKPKDWRDKIDHTLSGPKGGPVAFELTDLDAPSPDQATA